MLVIVHEQATLGQARDLVSDVNPGVDCATARLSPRQGTKGARRDRCVGVAGRSPRTICFKGVANPGVSNLILARHAYTVHASAGAAARVRSAISRTVKLIAVGRIGLRGQGIDDQPCRDHNHRRKQRG